MICTYGASQGNCRFSMVIEKHGDILKATYRRYVPQHLALLEDGQSVRCFLLPDVVWQLQQTIVEQNSINNIK